MLFKRLEFLPETVYHYTKKDNIESIIKDKKIKKFKDKYTFFTMSELDSDFLMSNLTCNPLARTRDYNGIIRTNTNKKEDYILLKLKVDRKYVDNTLWYSSDSTGGGNSKLAQEINSRTICYKGDLKYTEIEVIKTY